MTNMIFTFRRPVKDPDNTDKVILQDNYINPFNVISAYWDNRGERKILNVFTLTYTYTLNDAVGKAFLVHWESALRCIGAASVVAEPQQRERRPRPVMDATEVSDLDITEAANWQG